MSLLLGTVPLASRGEEPSSPDADKPAVAVANTKGDEEIRIREIFASHLPGTLKKNGFRLSLHPHLGDFDNRDFLRVSLGLRYGLTRTWEIGAGTDAYFAHGIGDAKFFSRYGIANIQFGSKWNLGNRILRNWDSAIGFEAVSPVDHPPAEMTDGLRHAVPFISFSRRLETRRDVRVFWSVGFDKVGHTDIPGEFKKNDLADSSNFVTVGAVMDRGRLHYTLESTAATTRLLGDTHRDSITLRPGVLWEIPSRKGGGEKSNWVLGAALKAVHGPDGMSYGASLKLRLNFDIKRLLGRQPKPAEPQP